ncbi:hypothetical protein NKI12_15180 [Mesorhizobium australicum]|uniref:Uncharacterized protein n=1 Tax=Mesorhizobium australicum TaxID=536018 RepID=A0ACC6T789_9HYPH
MEFASPPQAKGIARCALKFAFLVSLAIATPALAADLSPQPIQSAAYNWTGVYVDAQAGYVWGSSTYEGAGSPAGQPYISTSVDPKGGFGGAFAGFNYQFDGKSSVLKRTSISPTPSRTITRFLRSLVPSQAVI